MKKSRPVAIVAEGCRNLEVVTMVVESTRKLWVFQARGCSR